MAAAAGGGLVLGCEAGGAELVLTTRGGCTTSLACHGWCCWPLSRRAALSCEHWMRSATSWSRRAGWLGKARSARREERKVRSACLLGGRLARKSVSASDSRPKTAASSRMPACTTHHSPPPQVVG